MIHRFVVPVALLFPAVVAAQQGTITYTHSVKNDFEIPEAFARLREQLPAARTSTVILHFSPTESLMTRGPQEERTAGSVPMTDIARALGRDFRGDFNGRVFFGGRPGGRGSEGVLRESYVSYDEGSVVEIRGFMGRAFRISGERLAYEWRLTSEQGQHLGHMVIKATTEHDGKAVEAWFTPEIPVGGGPASYGGLPGIILVLSLDDGSTQYFATEIDLDGLDAGLIRVPDDGDEVTRDEFDEIVAEKLEELERTGRRGRRRPPGGGR